MTASPKAWLRISRQPVFAKQSPSKVVMVSSVSVHWTFSNAIRPFLLKEWKNDNNPRLLSPCLACLGDSQGPVQLSAHSLMGTGGRGSSACSSPLGTALLAERQLLGSRPRWATPTQQSPVGALSASGWPRRKYGAQLWVMAPCREIRRHVKRRQWAPGFFFPQRLWQKLLHSWWLTKWWHAAGAIQSYLTVGRSRPQPAIGEMPQLYCAAQQSDTPLLPCI